MPPQEYVPPGRPGRRRPEDDYEVGFGFDARRRPRSPGEDVLTHDWIRETFATIATEGRLSAFDQAPTQAQLRAARAQSGQMAARHLPTRLELEGTKQEQESFAAVADFFTSPNIGAGGLGFNWEN